VPLLRIVTDVEAEGVPIYYFSETREWWMPPADELERARVLHEHVDAIAVTNAYDLLPVEYVLDLARRAGRWPRPSGAVSKIVED